MFRRGFLAAPLLLAAPALAQGWSPTRPIRLVVPFAAGGAADNGARAMGARMAETLGQPVLVENRGGGAGAIAANAVAEAAPDGHTLLWAGQAVITTNPHLYSRLSYDPAAFVPISNGTRLPLVLHVHPSFPARTLAEWVAKVKAEPGQHAYGTVGRGGMTHVFAEQAEAIMGLDLQDVPYRGSGPMLSDAVAGNVKMCFDGVLPAINNHRAGQLRILAVSSERRLEAAPDIPTFAEQGWPQLTAYLWFGLFGLRGMPAGAVERLSAAVQEAARRPDIRERMARDGAEPVGSTPQEFGNLVEHESTLWGEVIRRANIRLTD